MARVQEAGLPELPAEHQEQEVGGRCGGGRGRACGGGQAGGAGADDVRDGQPSGGVDRQPVLRVEAAAEVPRYRPHKCTADHQLSGPQF